MTQENGRFAKEIKRKSYVFFVDFINRFSNPDEDLTMLRFTPFEVYYSSCAGPPRCQAFHQVFGLVILNLGVEITIAHGGENAQTENSRGNQQGTEQADGPNSGIADGDEQAVDIPGTGERPTGATKPVDQHDLEKPPGSDEGNQ